MKDGRKRTICRIALAPGNKLKAFCSGAFDVNGERFLLKEGDVITIDPYSYDVLINANIDYTMFAANQYKIFRE